MPTRCLLSFLWVTGLASAFLSALAAPPPYLIEASFSVETFQTNASARVEGAVSFVQSNGWWEVEADYGSPGRDKLKTQNCKKVPGGTRNFISFDLGPSVKGSRQLLSPERRADVLRTAATIRPMPHPSDPLLFDAWVSFSAEPELPLIDTKRIRRNLDLATYFENLVNAPENEGLYAIEYLTEGKTFISSLLITNRGFALDIEVKGGGELGTQITELRTQFLEYEQKVLGTTNIAGWTIPTRVETKRYGFTWSKGAAVPLLMKRTELMATRVTFAPEDLARHAARKLPPPQLDEYLVVDDKWQSVNGVKDVSR